MKFEKNHNFITLLSLLLIVAILSPSIVKVIHAIDNHEHFECKAIGELHIHEVELDCDFEKFNISPQQFLQPEYTVPILIVNNHKVDLAHYSFLSKYQKLHFSLRGPPITS